MRVIDGPSIVKAMLDSIRPEDKVSTRGTRDKLRKVSVATHEGGTNEMPQDVEESRNGVLAEGENHQDFAIDLLSTLAKVQDESFPRTLEKPQD